LGKREFSFARLRGRSFLRNKPSDFRHLLDDNQSVRHQKLFFQDKQTRSWQWLIEAKNSSNADIKLRIEEPVPQARNKKIHLNFKQNPEPVEKTTPNLSGFWMCPRGRKKTIQNNIELEAPSDMEYRFRLAIIFRDIYSNYKSKRPLWFFPGDLSYWCHLVTSGPFLSR